MRPLLSRRFSAISKNSFPKLERALIRLDYILSYFRLNTNLRSDHIQGVDDLFKLPTLDLDAVPVHYQPVGVRVFLRQFPQLLFPDAEILGCFFDGQRVLLPNGHIRITHTRAPPFGVTTYSMPGRWPQ